MTTLSKLIKRNDMLEGISNYAFVLSYPCMIILISDHSIMKLFMHECPCMNNEFCFHE
jgi:hypothetical protein